MYFDREQGTTNMSLMDLRKPYYKSNNLNFVKWQPMNLDNAIQNAKKFGLRPRFASHKKHFRNSQNAFIYPHNRRAKVVPYLLEKIEFPF